jgi:DNA adenine methylase
MKDIPQESVKPFLRWAGGKTWIQKNIRQYLPPSIKNYHEPFLGGGSVFINLKSIGYITNEAFLSDRNIELINSYDIIKTKLEALIELLQEFRNEKEFYYYLRNQNFTNNVQRAAQFIYLNRTSFNGIYRVNLRGEYNVPYGYKTYKELFDFDNLVRLRRLFENAFFNSVDFEETLGNIERNDLVFLDPPYTVAHGNNGFIKYNQKIFAWEDQERLLSFIETIKSKQAFFIMTNAAHQNIDNLFNRVGGKIIINRYSLVGGKGATRKEISEYLYTNANI